MLTGIDFLVLPPSSLKFLLSNAREKAHEPSTDYIGRWHHCTRQSV